MCPASRATPSASRESAGSSFPTGEPFIRWLHLTAPPRSPGTPVSRGGASEKLKHALNGKKQRKDSEYRDF